MITISKRVEELIEQWPLLKQGLNLKLMNTSSVSRYLKPKIEQDIGEKISEAAVLMALRRYQQHSQSKTVIYPADFLGDMSLRSHLVDLTYTNSPTLQRPLARLARELSSQYYFTFSRGLLQTSIIVHEDHLDYVQHELLKEYQEKQADNLTAITLHLKKGHDQISGILSYPLQLLAWRGITVVEVVSTYDELNIVLYDKDVQNAFSTLKSALK